MIASSAVPGCLPISQLLPGEQAEVVELVGDGSEVRRLSEIGLRVGTRVRMIRRGMPCLLALDGKRLSIRLSQGAEVLVAARP